MVPPLSHPLPAKPATAPYQPPAPSTRPGGSQSAGATLPTPVTATPLSLPNRPNPPPLASLASSTSSSRPPLPPSTSSFFGAAASPKLPGSSASSQAGRDPGVRGHGELPWPRVRARLNPEEATVNSELIELGQGWSVQYKCWKGPAIPLAGVRSRAASSAAPFPDAKDYDPFLLSVPSTVPSKKKTRPSTNAVDHVFADDLAAASSPRSGGASSLPPTPLIKHEPAVRTDASTSKLDHHFETSRSTSLDQDPLERARRDLIRRGKAKVEEGGDNLDLMCFVEVAGTRLEHKGRDKKQEDTGKGKGKEKEQGTIPEEDKVEAAGRTLWAFCVIRGGDSDSSKVDLDDLAYDGLECIATGTFDHQTLYPALYPPSSNSTSSAVPPGSSPLSRSAQSYPSALALSANFLASSSLRPTPLAAAHQSFLSAIENVLMSEIISSSRSMNDFTWQRIGNSLVLLPPTSSFPSDAGFFDPTASPSSPRKRSQPLSSLSTFRTSLQRSTILAQVHTKEVPYRSFPADSPPPGSPILLAPLGLRARLVKRVRVDERARTNELTAKWQGQLAGSSLEIEGNEWIYCRLDVAPPDTDDAEYDEGDTQGEELVWPQELVVLDRTRPPPPPSPLSSPDKVPSTDLVPEATSQQTYHLSPTSPNAKFPSAPVTTPENTLPSSQTGSRSLSKRRILSPCDSRSRRRLADKVFGGSMRRDLVANKLARDPLARRTNEIWTWMEDETVRRAKEAEEEQARMQKEKDEQEERKRLEGQGREGVERDKLDESSNSGGPTKLGQHPPPAVAAPINMRTPMSLGTSSTEAPSPADAAYALPGYTNTTTSQQAYLTPPTTTRAGRRAGGIGAGDSMDVDGLGLGLYPSPEEPIQRVEPVSTSAEATTSSQPMSSLDNAFASFDWGDGSYGTSGGGSGAGGGGLGGQDFDDGMDFPHLTDDDFSFFDTAPTPNPVVALGSSNDMSLAITQEPFTMPLSTSTSPKYVDHFSHLSAPPFASSASPMSTYPAHTSPQFAVQTSPIATTSSHFQFDPQANALGLAATSSLTHQPSPPDSLGSPKRPLVGLAVPSFSVELARRVPPRSPHPVSPHHTRRVLPIAFAAIPFAPSYDVSSDKYDACRGKFGLPTPDSEDDDPDVGRDPNRSLGSIVPCPTASSLETWYTGICDPRRAVAERLQRDRKARLKRARSASRGRAASSMSSRGWKRAVSRGDEWSDGTATADEESEFGSDIEVEDQHQDDMTGGRTLFDAAERGQLEEYRSLLESRGVELVGLGSLAAAHVKRHATARSEPNPIPTATLQAHELLLITLVEQGLVNPASRSLFETAFPEKLPELLSTSAIGNVAKSLAAVCSTLSPSPLFADHTLLPLLEATAGTSITIRSQQAMVQVSTAAVEFWKPMGFEPLIGRKDVTVFAIYEDGGHETREIVSQWLEVMATTYQGLRLGEQSSGHLPPSAQFGGTQDGHLALPAGTFERGLSKEDSKVLATAMADIAKLFQSVVLYVFSPGSKGTGPTASPLFSLLHLLQRSKPPLSSMVTYPVPLSQVYAGVSMSSRTPRDRLDSSAFSLYDQLHVPVERLRLPVPETFPSAASTPNLASQSPLVRLFQSPAIKVSPVRPRRIGFDLNFPVSTLAVEHRHRFLHVCYTSSPANTDGTSDWIHIASIDDTGETWRTVNRFVKTPPGGAGDVMRCRLVWQIILQLLVIADVEWRIVVCRLGEPSVVETRAWDSMLKDQLSGIRRPIHATFVFVDLNPPLAVLPSNKKVRRASVQSDTISEEGELNLLSRPAAVSASKPEPLFDREPTILAFTPSEPVNVLPAVKLFAPASTYLVHVPRIPTFTHSTVDSPASRNGSPEPISIYAIHFLLSNASRTTSYVATLSDLVKDVRQSYCELSALARVRWKMNGRLPWHLEAVKLAREIAESLPQRATP